MSEMGHDNRRNNAYDERSDKGQQYWLADRFLYRLTPASLHPGVFKVVYS
jgi:hypothetical protein